MPDPVTLKGSDRWVPLKGPFFLGFPWEVSPCPSVVCLGAQGWMGLWGASASSFPVIGLVLLHRTLRAEAWVREVDLVV